MSMHRDREGRNMGSRGNNNSNAGRVNLDIVNALARVGLDALDYVQNNDYDLVAITTRYLVGCLLFPEIVKSVDDCLFLVRKRK